MLSKFNYLELKIRTPGQSLETFADYLKDLHKPDELESPSSCPLVYAFSIGGSGSYHELGTI